MQVAGSIIAVTGATGFFGRNLVLDLLQAGARVVAVVRSPHKATDLAALGVELRQADVFDVAALTRAFEGCDAVVVSAALVSLGSHAVADVLETNVRGTRHQLQAAADAGVRRVVFMSSTEAYVPRRDHAYAEDCALRDGTGRVHKFNVYSVSKGLAEREAWRVAQAADLQLTTVRPSGVHGAFDKGTLTWGLRLLMSLPVAPVPVCTWFTSVYVGDIAAGTLRILERDASIGRAYNLCGDPEVTVWAITRAWMDAGGRAPWMTVPVPLPLRHRYDISRAAHELGWMNRPLVDGFRQMFERERAFEVVNRQLAGS